MKGKVPLKRKRNSEITNVSKINQDLSIKNLWKYYLKKNILRSAKVFSKIKFPKTNLLN